MLLALVAAVALPHVASAQDAVTDFQLPPAPTPTPTSRTQGPVDPENPFRTRPSAPGGTPTAQPSAPPTITPLPVITESAEASPRPSARATRAAPSPAARPPAPTPSASTATGAAAAAPPAPQPSSETPAATPASPGQASPEAGGALAAPAASDGTPWLWAALAAILAVIAAAGLLLAQRRKQSKSAPRDADDRAPPAAAPTPAAPAALPPAVQRKPAAPPPSRPAATPDRASTACGLSVSFEPVNLRISLAYATIAYRLSLANDAPEPLGPIEVRGDLITAHRSLDSRAQLSPDSADLEHKHSLASLAPGASQVLAGELRLPLDQVLGFRKGKHGFFVPLARFRLVSADGNAAPRIYTVGTPGPGEVLGPICADMPRLFNDVAAREIETGRWLGLDPVRAAG
ncbi:hypothetical protein B2G71_09950 [Novosphingobium sp. PC22D]|nr:hypothetical protein B2G71_09950 [Novosphingobium sp. PC22D]